MRGGDDDAMDLLRAASSSRARPASQGVQPDPPTSFTSPRKVRRRARLADTANHRISAEERTRLVPLVPVIASRRLVTARVSIPRLTLHTHHLPRAFRLRADLHRGHAEGGGGEGRARGKSQGGVPIRRVSRRSRRREPAPERRAVGSADASRGNARRPGERERTAANASEHEALERRGAGTRDGGRRGAPPPPRFLLFFVFLASSPFGVPTFVFLFCFLESKSETADTTRSFSPPTRLTVFLTVFHFSFVT